MGAYKPHFASISDDYFPTTKSDIILGTILLIIVIVGIMVGFMFWIL